MKKISILLALFGALVLLGAGCITIGPKSSAGADAGVFKSVNKGNDWQQKNTAPTAQGIGNIAGIDVVDMVFDPQDNKAIYLSSPGSGLFYSWDAAESWHYVEALGSGFVNSIAIDYKDKCTLYTALQNKIFKSSDCARSWQELYFDTRGDAFVSYLATDPKNSNIIYAGLSKGEFLKSVDAGRSWTTIHRFNNKIVKIFINPKDSNQILAGFEREGLWKSLNAGNSWQDLRENTKDFLGSNEIFDIIADKNADTIFLATAYGIIKSSDFGKTWTNIELLTPPGNVHIYALAVNPNNIQEIYYATASTFYSSFDGGKNWITKKLPTSRAGSAILVDPQNENVLYMGARSFNK